METCIKIGIDMGGSKTAIIALSMSGKVLFQSRIQTPQNDYKTATYAIAGLVAQVNNTCQGDPTTGRDFHGDLSDASEARGAARLWG